MAPTAATTIDQVHAAIMDLPIEVLACIVQYLVQADDLQDLLHLSQTCRVLHHDLWSSSSDIWPYIWTVLYGDNEPCYPGPIQDRCRLAIQSRHRALGDVRRTSTLMLSCAPNNREPIPGDEMRKQILCLLDVGADYGTKESTRVFGEKYSKDERNTSFWAWGHRKLTATLFHQTIGIYSG
jgi:hypothetical protein